MVESKFDRFLTDNYIKKMSKNLEIVMADLLSAVQSSKHNKS